MWEKPPILGVYDVEDILGSDFEGEGDSEEEGESQFDSDLDSLGSDSEEDEDGNSRPGTAQKVKRRRKKGPRSKAQMILDRAEDAKERVRNLSLAHLNSQRFSVRLWEITTLISLNISHNRLGRLSEGVAELTLLEELNVSFNLLHSIPIHIQVPSLIGI